jgi:hypothetical protein
LIEIILVGRRQPRVAVLALATTVRLGLTRARLALTKAHLVLTRVISDIRIFVATDCIPHIRRLLREFASGKAITLMGPTSRLHIPFL